MEKKRQKQYYKYSPQTSVVFFIDYLPILMKRNQISGLLYLIYHRTKDRTTSVLEMPTDDLVDHFGVDRATILDGNTVLQKLKLIVAQDRHTDDLVFVEVMDPAPIDETKRVEIYTKFGLKLDTHFRVAFANRAASTFKKKLKVLPGVQETRAYMDKFEEAKTVAISSWNASHMLSYFLVRYEKRYRCEFSFINEKAIWNGKEIKDIKGVINRFKGDTVAAKRYLDWVFDVKSRDPKLDGLERTGLLVHQNMLQEYRRVQASGGRKPGQSIAMQVSGNSGLDENFVAWVKNHYPQLGYPLETQEHLRYLMQANDGADSSIDAIVMEAKKRQLVK